MTEAEPSEYGDIFSLIDKMYKILADARSGFMDQDLIKVSRSSLENLLDQLKQALPTQLKSAVEIMRSADARMGQAVSEAEKTTRAAEAHAEKIVSEAQKRADYIASNDNIVKIASQRADAMMGEAKAKSARIMNEAQKRAAELKASSEQWCLENLQSFMEVLKKMESTAYGGIENIKIKQRQGFDKRSEGK